jgi:hypothetical protein
MTMLSAHLSQRGLTVSDSDIRVFVGKDGGDREYADEDAWGVWVAADKEQRMARCVSHLSPTPAIPAERQPIHS